MPYFIYPKSRKSRLTAVEANLTIVNIAQSIISFGIIGPILVTLKIEYRLKRC